MVTVTTATIATITNNTTTTEINRKSLSVYGLSNLQRCNISGLEQDIELKLSGKVERNIKLNHKVVKSKVVKKGGSGISYESLRA